MKRLSFLFLAIVMLTGCIESFDAYLVRRRMERQTYVNTHPELSENVKTAIKEGHLLIGMTEDQVKIIRGAPDEINYTTTAYGSSEQWVYGHMAGTHYSTDDYLIPDYFLYFEHGLLTAIQD